MSLIPSLGERQIRECRSTDCSNDTAVDMDGSPQSGARRSGQKQQYHNIKTPGPELPVPSGEYREKAEGARNRQHLE